MNHGDSYTVNGSGFGSKDASVPTVWDNCQGADGHAAVLDKWTIGNHTGGGTDTEEIWGEGYRTPTDSDIPSPGGPAQAHTRSGNKYLCGCHQNGTDTNDAYAANVYVCHSFTRPSYPYYLVASYYMRVDDRWIFTGDKNFKFWGYSTGSNGIYGAQYYYIEARNTTGFADLTSPIEIGSIDDGGGPNDWQSTFGIDNFLNWTANWIKVEHIIKVDITAGFGRTYAGAIGDTLPLCHTVSGDMDGYSGTSRTAGIGGYARAINDNNLWRYFQDLYLDIQTANPGRFYLTNHATWGSETIREIQPYTSWSATSVNLTANGGVLTDGTVHLHYRDEVNGDQYLGTLTLGSADPSVPYHGNRSLR